jgi:hypothetical protein
MHLTWRRLLRSVGPALVSLVVLQACFAAPSLAVPTARAVAPSYDYDSPDEVLGRQNPGTQLDRLEEYFIRELGGPTTMRNPFGRLQNRRRQMRDERYFAAGGGY